MSEEESQEKKPDPRVVGAQKILEQLDQKRIPIAKQLDTIDKYRGVAIQFTRNRLANAFNEPLTDEEKTALYNKLEQEAKKI